MEKRVTSEMQDAPADKYLPLFVGWGYMREPRTCRAYADARVVKIAGGSIDVMKTIIARDMFKSRLAARRPQERSGGKKS